MHDQPIYIMPGPNDPIQIFVSYAQDDNSVAPGIDQEKGFVTTLVNHLNYIFTKRGHPKPKIWLDQRQIDKADRFDQPLQEAIKRSSLLLVVLSRTWLSRPWCRWELDLFAKRENCSEQIVLVRASHVDRLDHPSELRNIVGYDFFSLDDWREPGNERFFFDRGEVQDKLFLRHVDELGSILWRRANNIRKKLEALTTRHDEEKKTAEEPASRPAQNGRTIYLAKPASDMMTVYHRIANDLVWQGYTVVPPVDQRIPTEAASLALGFIDSALKLAEASIHLVGEKRGSKPDEELDYIVPLQLARAAERVKSSSDASSFRRIIWAPKAPEEGCDIAVEGFREPIAVLNRFDEYRQGDQVYGDVSSAFLTNLKRDLDRSPVAIDPEPDSASYKPDARIYVWHREDDRDFARRVRKWLRENHADAILPGNDADPNKDKLHRKNLTECDAVFLCWGNASDVWAKMSASELRSWRDLGRKEKFSVRGLVLGPPPGESKSEDDLPSIPQEIDDFLDLSKDDQPKLERLQPLLDRSRVQHP